MAHSIACVSFLNSKPLIDPLVRRQASTGVQVHFAVPAKLLSLVESGIAAAGLLSVVDYQASARDLWLVPAGMIGCDGPTLTVRIYSRVPADKIRAVYGDTDSHTSVILAQLILRELYGVAAPLLPFEAHEGEHTYGARGPETMLLIGDKVVSASPDPREYPYQLDLGEAWKELTGLPFVFAMWMMRRDYPAPHSAELAKLLADARRRGADLTEELLDRYATEKGWPRELARKYFTQYLRYEVTFDARRGLARFFEMAAGYGLLAARRPIEYFEVPG